MKLRRIFTLGILLLVMASSSEASWLIYHDSELNGTILDMDTKLPIEGAVVVVNYTKKTMGIGASMSSVMEIRETLTDKDGNFHIPYYTTFIQPFSWQILPSFIIYKPGYASLNMIAFKDFFTGKERKNEEGFWPGPEFKGLIYRLRGTGTVELPKLKTREQRLHSMPSPVADIDYKDQKLLIQLLNEEGKNLGLKGQYKIEE